MPLSHGPHFKQLKHLMREQGLHTICEEALCPNIGECWGEFRTASFLILGDVCTRNCGFCDVKTGRPGDVDWAEPTRLADAVARLELRHVVITSVTRDDLPDGGAAVFAATIRQIKRRDAAVGVEVLIPDFQGNWDALATVMDAGPDVLNHNIETVPAPLPPRASESDLHASRSSCSSARTRSRRASLPSPASWSASANAPTSCSRSSATCRQHGVDVLTVGQYLRPTLRHLPVERYVPLEEFDQLKAEARALGFRHVECGPLVRSSYHAHDALASRD